MVHFEGTEAPVIPLMLQPQIHHPLAFNSHRETGITVLQNRGWNISQANPNINPAPSGLSLQLCTVSHVIFRQHFPIYFLITPSSSSTQDIIPILTHTHKTPLPAIKYFLPPRELPGCGHICWLVYTLMSSK